MARATRPGVVRSHSVRSVLWPRSRAGMVLAAADSGGAEPVGGRPFDRSTGVAGDLTDSRIEDLRR